MLMGVTHRRSIASEGALPLGGQMRHGIALAEQMRRRDGEQGREKSLSTAELPTAMSLSRGLALTESASAASVAVVLKRAR